jgi:hypothetical protein
VDNGVDEDCDGGDICYVDSDDDGYREMSGATMSSTDLSCTGAGEGTASEPATDCDDSNAGINPGAIELASDSIDANCDGAETCYVDYDNDGFRSMTTDTVDSIDSDCDDPGEGSEFEPATDCDDEDASIYPNANEAVADGIDQDCDGGEMCYMDSDADGYRGSDGATSASADLDCSDFGEADATMTDSDCDDLNATINQDAMETVADGIDQNCDSIEECWVDADSDGYREIGDSTVESVDLDCDDIGEGSADEAATDCDDTVSYAYPGATELVGDEADQDCDGTEICYVDEDGDGYRTLETVQSLDADCTDPTEASIDMPAGDCNDSAAGINPGAEEIPGDGADQDCDGADEITDDPNAEPSTEPSSEPSAEPSDGVVDGNETASEGEKSGCSQINSATMAWMLFAPALILTRRRRVL